MEHLNGINVIVPDNRESGEHKPRARTRSTCFLCHSAIYGEPRRFGNGVICKLCSIQVESVGMEWSMARERLRWPKDAKGPLTAPLVEPVAVQSQTVRRSRFVQDWLEPLGFILGIVVIIIAFAVIS